MRKATSEIFSSSFVSRREAFSRRTLSNTCWKLVLSSRSFDCSARPLIPMLCATPASFGWPSPMAKFRSRATFDSMLSPCRARVNSCSA